MESKAPEIPSSGLYWEQSNGLRHLLYFILLYPFEVSKPNKKLLLRFTREGNSRTKENHSPSSLNWARYRKEDESVTALREQGMGAKSIKRRKAQVQLPPLPQPQCTTCTHKRHLRLQVPLSHKSFIFGKQSLVQTYSSRPAIAQAARERDECGYLCVQRGDRK